MNEDEQPEPGVLLYSDSEVSGTRLRPPKRPFSQLENNQGSWSLHWEEENKSNQRFHTREGWW
jgi:hypothetical protein